MLSVSHRLAKFVVLGVLLTAVCHPAAAQDDGEPRDGGVVDSAEVVLAAAEDLAGLTAEDSAAAAV